MSLSRSCKSAFGRPISFVLPLRPAYLHTSRRTYASQPPEKPSSKAEIVSPSSTDDAKPKGVETASKPAPPEQSQQIAFLDRVNETFLRKEEILNPKRPSASSPDSNAADQGGQIVRGSIFDEEIQTSKMLDDKLRLKGDKSDPFKRNVAAMQSFLDPQPNATQRWLRKKVAQRVKRRGVLTKDEVRKQTERELRNTSDFWKTSIKKLAPLARLVAGKTVDEALVQMRFSKKMAARRIYRFLLESRDRAIVERGMNLDKDLEEPVPIKLKNGDKRVIGNTSHIYIDQAWVGQGSYGQELEYRARGRINIRRPPTTSFSVLLKEEKTRVREHDDRQRRSTAKKPWLQMPNRPVTAQRQYYCW